MIAEKSKQKTERFEWLQSYRDICDQIEFLEFELRRYEWELSRWVTGDLREAKLQEGSLGTKVEDNIEQIKERIVLKTEWRDELIKLVDTFKGLDHKILKLRYVDGMTLGDIAVKLNYSVSHIKKRHAELLRTIGFLKKYHLGSL